MVPLIALTFLLALALGYWLGGLLADKRPEEATLSIAQTTREAWEGSIRDWFRETLPVSWKQALPSLVVVQFLWRRCESVVSDYLSWRPS